MLPFAKAYDAYDGSCNPGDYGAGGCSGFRQGCSLQQSHFRLKQLALLCRVAHQNYKNRRESIQLLKWLSIGPPDGAINNQVHFWQPGVRMHMT